MKDNKKPPLSIYILYDACSEQAKKLYEHIYHLLCRNPQSPLESSLGISVYHRIKYNNKISSLDFESNEYTIVIALVDVFMYGDNDWEKYVKKISDKTGNNSNIFLLPIALCEYATDFAGLNLINMIKYVDNEIFNHIDDFDLRIFDYVISILKGTPEKPLQIFISHAKKDGKEKANELKKYIAMNTKLHYFYDANSIKDGVDFEKNIKENVDNSLLVVLNSDAYNDRDWCQREITIAKEAYCPIVLVDLVEHYVSRAFPYLGNIPWVAYKNNNWQSVLKELLRTALKAIYQKKFLQYIIAARNKTGHFVLPYTPELFTITKIKEKNILYPDPILGYSEKELLKKRYPKKYFYTPSQYISKKPSFLFGKRIAVSVSNVDENSLMIQDIMVELARHIIINCGHLVYGGDLRKEGYTNIFSKLAKNYKESHVEAGNIYTNFFAWPISLLITAEDKAAFKHSGVEIKIVDPPEMEGLIKEKYLKPDSDENKYLWSQALTKMRVEKERNSDILIIAGGKTKGFIGKMPGILEEFLIAIRHNHPVYLLGGYGGMAKIIAKIINGSISKEQFIEMMTQDKDYNIFIKYYNNNCSPDELIDFDKIYSEINNNKSLVNAGLSKKEQHSLLCNCNILESVELIFKGIYNIIKKE